MSVDTAPEILAFIMLNGNQGSDRAKQDKM